MTSNFNYNYENFNEQFIFENGNKDIPMIEEETGMNYTQETQMFGFRTSQNSLYLEDLNPNSQEIFLFSEEENEQQFNIHQQYPLQEDYLPNHFVDQEPFKTEIKLEYNTSTQESSNYEQQQGFCEFIYEDKCQNQVNFQKNKSPFYVQKKSQDYSSYQQFVNNKSNKGTKDYEKNICRNMTKWIIASILECSNTNSQHREYSKLMEFCNEDSNIFREFRSYFYQNQENNEKFLNGPKSVQRFLLSDRNEDAHKFVKIFKEFSLWYLEFRAMSHILEGKLKNKKKYIHYKNNIMRRLMKTPAQWPFNKNNN